MPAKEKPAHIKRAIAADNLEQLRVSGAAGGRATAEANKIRKDRRDDVNDFFDEKKLAEETRRATSTNEDIVPIDDSKIGNAETSPENRHPEQQ